MVNQSLPLPVGKPKFDPVENLLRELKSTVNVDSMIALVDEGICSHILELPGFGITSEIRVDEVDLFRFNSMKWKFYYTLDENVETQFVNRNKKTKSIIEAKKRTCIRKYNLAWTFVRYQSLARRISAKEGYSFETDNIDSDQFMERFMYPVAVWTPNCAYVVFNRLRAIALIDLLNYRGVINSSFPFQDTLEGWNIAWEQLKTEFEDHSDEIVARDGSQKRGKLMDDLQKWED
ncbi:hypothetical protein RCL1_000604 [Eukaryota sp. TZLM3-RCL]